MKSENFSISEKFYETVKSVYISFSLLAKTVSFLMIYEYLIHFFSVRDSQNVNVKYLNIVTTCDKRILSQANF